MEKNTDNQKKPLKLSSSGRLQIRKNLGPTGGVQKNIGAKKLFKLFLETKIINKKVPLLHNQILEDLPLSEPQV